MVTRKVLFFLVICMLARVLSSSNSDPNEVDASNSLLVHNLDTGLNYTTIQEAIIAFETLDGHTIFVEQGIYSGHITVHKALSIIGEDKETTIIDGRNLGYGIYITASNVNITGFTIQNCSPTQSGYGVIIDNTPIYYKKSVRNRISGNIIKNNVRAIHFRNSSMNTISENLIINNTEGIYVEDGGYNTISNNYLKNNTQGLVYSGTHNIISNNTLYSSPITWLAFAHYSRINHNLLFDNSAIFLHRSNYSVVYQNTMTNGLGITVYGHHSIIYENTVTKSNTGFTVGGSNNTLFNNTMSENENAGIYIIGDKNTISENNITDNQIGVRLSGYNNSIFHNNFINNTYQVYIQTQGYTSFWDDGYPSGGNYWEDYPLRYPYIVDIYYGIYQNASGADGFWDAPYIIDENNQDNYPLIPEHSAFILLIMLATSLVALVYKKKEQSLTC